LKLRYYFVTYRFSCPKIFKKIELGGLLFAHHFSSSWATSAQKSEVCDEKISLKNRYFN